METSIEMNPLLDVPETEEVKIDLDTTTTLSMHTSEEGSSDHIHEVASRASPSSDTEFKVSFTVDAQGGSWSGCRYTGVKIVIPPGKASMPTRIICWYLKNDKDIPTLLNEGEILVSKILDLSWTRDPKGSHPKFLG